MQVTIGLDLQSGFLAQGGFVRARTISHATGFPLWGYKIRTAFVAASLIPALFVICLFALTLYTAPEHDDLCFAARYVRVGFVPTIIDLYRGATGRIVPIILIQLPAAISTKTGISLVSAYELTMAACAMIFLAGISVAVARWWPSIRGLPLFFMAVAFASALLGALPSVRDLLYWLPAVSSYTPAAILSALILGECVRALYAGSGFSNAATYGIASGGFVAALCNEFTGAWLIVFVVSSVLGRQAFGQILQIRQHVLIAVAVLTGFAIVVFSGGSNSRLAALNGAGHAGDIALSLRGALDSVASDLLSFLKEPPVAAWLLVAATMTLAEPEPVRPGRGSLLAFGVLAICLVCIYFEYFMHEFSTGGRLVERAANEAMMLFLFGLTMVASLLTRVYRPGLRRLLGSSSLSLGSLTLPLLLGVLMTISVLLSSAASLLFSQRNSLRPYWQESVERQRLVATSSGRIVTVPKHTWKPSLLMSADLMATNGCLAALYDKSDVLGGEPEGSTSAK
ncbi:hypothetical protein [Bradyrhizobium sp. BR 10289]|uniref:hypothetical protein n=1 Tax=Bradyrhizobium sp. BR 10289 TaxID=2749993 RepID=UPI001C645BBD|nr:hypothetical protein [Bradyrhizobium sp. BR 10289]MBW7974209.1 hypothetical protein [Bradyrhizobium sp. BR 10289]